MAAGISSLIQAWKSFDLIKFQTDLDQIATELAERQDGSDISRKRLIEQSREFKKNSSEEARKEAAPVLKAFQNEIDNLTKRSKAAESAFLSVYKKIVNAQDPVPSLEYIHTIQSRLTKVSELEIENKQLKDTIEENNREFAEIRNQEITIKNLRDRIKENDEKIDSRVADRIRDRERELTKLFMEKERQLHEDKVETLRKLGDIEKKYSSLQIAYESTQAELFDLRSRNEEAQGAKSSELDLVMGDLDLANQNLAAAEKEIETLQSTVLDLRNSQSPKNKEKFEEVLDRLTKSSLEAELSTKEKELTQLVNENHRLSQQVTLVNDKLEVNRVNYSNNLGKLQEEIDKLKDQLQRCSDYEDTKRELNIMKSIEFQESADESEDAKPLEILLLEKNRSQQNELISLRNQHLQLQDASESKLTDPQILAQHVQDELLSQGISIKILSRDLGVQGLRSLLQNPPHPSSMSHGDKDVFEKLQNWLKEQQSLQESMRTPKSLRETSEAVQKILSEARMQMENDSPSTSTTTENSSFLDAENIASSALNCYSSSSRPTLLSYIRRTQLQPLSSEVIQKYANGGINCKTLADEVRKVLEISSIPQRVFGHYVLGTSQSSVSDLLLHPRSWENTTYKGQESYIRMKLWLEDSNGITNLKKLASTFQADIDSLSNLQRNIDTSSFSDLRSQSSSDYMDDLPTQVVREEGPYDSNLVLSTEPSVSQRITTQSSQASSGVITRKSLPLTEKVLKHYWACGIDTKAVAVQGKGLMYSLGVGQKQLGEHVLGLSQASVCDLLNKPKDWNLLNKRVKQAYIRLKLWVDNPNVDNMISVIGCTSNGASRLKRKQPFDEDVINKKLSRIDSDDPLGNLTGSDITLPNSSDYVVVPQEMAPDYSPNQAPDYDSSDARSISNVTSSTDCISPKIATSSLSRRSTIEQLQNSIDSDSIEWDEKLNTKHLISKLQNAVSLLPELDANWDD